ncbi:diphosphate--fructose-6-phosphate 1-phosphotransferase [Virgibacillus sp. YIM 98842]|uniref:diphosphate--fructose-6-phosphate 1-phosphotransferase n=1 Tax=Virgibacillus sp. YIM 98842 TaxID=2663533 RepID=UPI0013DC732A|nr:diphosphate--fructose-6-phosphate 1-phosphotransferase [Virgibacillus sp. YIM 98842]
MKKVAIGQAGGPTSVINATLVGLVKELMHDVQLSFICNGYDGLVHENMRKGNNPFLNWIFQQENKPGACLGSGRYPMSHEEVVHAVEFLKNEKVNTLIFIGGNGTMEALHRIDLEAMKQGYELQVIGIPKTVDNDINYTDHAPGFGSAANYVAHATRNLSYDLQSMKNFEQVRIIETMGRNAGWLAAASGYFKKSEEEGPHIIALPERRMRKESLMSAIESAVSRYGYAVMVVSEGVVWEEGNQIEKDIIHDRIVLGGISNEIENSITEQLHVKVRSEILGMNQRSFSPLVSPVDKEEAYLAGITGGYWVKQDLSSVMVSIRRLQEERYEIQMKPVSLKDVAHSGERLLPDHFIDNPKRYYDWLRPFMEDSGVNQPILASCNKLKQTNLNNH